MKNETELQGAKEVYTVKEFLKLKKKPSIVCVDELELVLGKLLDCCIDSATITERREFWIKKYRRSLEKLIHIEEQ